MNEKLLKLLEHLLVGGSVENGGKLKYSFAGFILRDDVDGTTENVSTKKLENMEIYLDDKDKEILELKKQLIVKDRELFELKEPSHSRAGCHYKHLSVDEVGEIEQIFISTPFASVINICATYNSSTSVVGRIRNGIHVKSSSWFSKRFKEALDEANKSDSN